MKFPSNFYFGGATSASQIEGGYNLGNKGLSIYDVRTAGSKDSPRYYTYVDENGKVGKFAEFLEELPKNTKYKTLDGYYYPSHRAIDFYHHYKEDIKLLAEANFKMFRMSIDWTRIYPLGIEEKPNKEGLEFYRNIFKELRKYNIEPLVTLWHGETPLYIENELGGWNNKETIKLFTKYTETVFEEYKGLVNYYLTFNEINNVLMFLDIMPEHLANKKAQSTFELLHNRLLASALTVKIGHEIDKNNKIGCMICYGESYAHTCDPKDAIANMEAMQRKQYYCSDVQVRGYYPSYANRIWKQYNVKLDITNNDKEILKEGTVDFYSFSYYCSAVETCNKQNNEVKGNFTAGIKNPYLEYSKWGWSIDPMGLRHSLNEIYDRYQIPIMVAENGLGTYDSLTKDKQIHDDYRIDYLRKHIQALKEALNDGVELFAYTIWGCIDEISMVTGEMDKRYGIIYVDLNNQGEGTLKRYKKDSFYWYKRVIESGGEEL